MAVKIEINEDDCIGCGACVATCDSCFEVVDGKAKAKEGCEDADKAKEAADNCPVGCISVSED